MENKNYASWVPDVHSFLWILWVVYFPIEHLCPYNEISYSFPFKCKCYSKCNHISLIIVLDSICRSSLLHVHLSWLLKILMLWRQRWTAIFLLSSFVKVSKCILEQLRLWYFKLFRLIHCFLSKQEDIMSFFNATFPDFVQVMGE